ncbi:hypothetical protein K474DRAFT_85834 [Panus rudis PR-1116 ss-1]|nr:hypothetical protein K474DRAFT_85834 [Panus rudis PR-1116 ss-1]
MEPLERDPDTLRRCGLQTIPSSMQHKFITAQTCSDGRRHTTISLLFYGRLLQRLQSLSLLLPDSGRQALMQPCTVNLRARTRSPRYPAMDARSDGVYLVVLIVVERKGVLVGGGTRFLTLHTKRPASKAWHSHFFSVVFSSSTATTYVLQDTKVCTLKSYLYVYSP